MTQILRKPVTDASVWTAADMADPDVWTITLSDHHLRELNEAVSASKSAPKDQGGAWFDRAAFPLPSLGPVLEDALEEIQDGRGFVVLRGLEPNRYGLDDLDRLLWGIGTWLGQGIIQNTAGDRIGRVMDHGEAYEGDDPYKSGVRGYRTTVGLPPHTDSCDIVGLLCVRRALSGGESSVVSATALYNAILRERPDLIDPLCQGFRIDQVGKGANADQISSRRIPVFSYFGGKLSARYNKRQIELGAERSGHPLTPEQSEAVALVRSLSVDPSYRLPIDLAPGDIQLINNRTTFHAREAFTDRMDADRKRLMLRLWLSTPEGRPLAPELADQLDTGARAGVRVGGRVSAPASV